MSNIALYADAEGKAVVRRDIPSPEPTNGELLIQVLFSGVNPADLRMVERLGCHNRVLGTDFCGRVLETPGPVSRFQVGDVVAGYTSGSGDRPLRYGAHQSYISTPPKGIFKVPENMPLADAAGLMTVVQTANDALYNRLGLPLPSTPPTPTEGTLVIWGGSTAVGMSAIQLARASGVASIIVTASTGRHGLLKELGATQCFDYKNESVVSDVSKAIQEAGHSQIWGFETAGSEESSRLFLEALADAKGSVRTSFVAVEYTNRPASEGALGSRHIDLVFHIAGMPQPLTMPARPDEAKRMWTALEWAVKNYGSGFKLPGTKVFEGSAEDALDKVTTVSNQGSFGKVVLKHPLA